MHPPDVRRKAMALLARGRSLNSVSVEMGVSRATLRSWRDRAEDPCQDRLAAPEDIAGANPGAYAALLGYYLGDGCLSHHRRTMCLRVFCDARHPGVVEDVAAQILAVRGRGPVGRHHAPGCVVVQAYWNSWVCLFPQHGPGRKHERRLTLEPWQQEIIAECTGDFLRGLFHSDGCRTANWTSRLVAGERKRYEYPRWQFVNHSADIRQWCTEGLDRLDVRWRMSNWKTVSVSRRADVARLDQIVGPKT